MNAVRFAVSHFGNFLLQRASFRSGRSFGKPSQIFLSVTERCCLKCSMCDFWKNSGNEHEELGFEEWRRTLANLAKWLGPSGYIQFTGGEPFLRSDMVELIRWTRSLGMRSLVNSNGVLIDDVLARQINRSGLNYLSISLDGLTAGTYERVRGTAGAHRKVLSGIRRLAERKSSGLVLGISAILMQSNLDELVPLVRWAERSGVDRIGFHALHRNNTPAGDMGDWHRHSPMWITDFEKLDAVLDQLLTMKSEGSPIINSIRHLEMMKSYYRNPHHIRRTTRCRVGWNNFRIGADGAVQLCHGMEAVGNVRQDSPRAVWNSLESGRRRKEIANCKRRCTAKCVWDQTLLEKMQLFIFLARKGAFGSR